MSGHVQVLENGTLQRKIPSYVTIKGEIDYFVTMEINRIASTTNSSVSLAAFSKSDRNIAIAVKYQWSRHSPKGLMVIPGTSNTYQCSPRDLGQTIEVKIVPFEEGFNGACGITYGPVCLEDSTEDHLKKTLDREYFETTCRGKSLKSGKKYSRVKVDTYEIQLFDSYNGLLDTFRINSKLQCTVFCYKENF
jgi:hypothetical protein